LELEFEELFELELLELLELELLELFELEFEELLELAFEELFELEFDERFALALLLPPQPRSKAADWFELKFAALLELVRPPPLELVLDERFELVLPERFELVLLDWLALVLLERLDAVDDAPRMSLPDLSTSWATIAAFPARSRASVATAMPVLPIRMPVATLVYRVRLLIVKPPRGRG
jgi:hypothetical protein